MHRQVNKKVGKGLVSAIEKGEEATEKTKQSMGEYRGCSSIRVRGPMSRTDCFLIDSGMAKEKANQVRGECLGSYCAVVEVFVRFHRLPRAHAKVPGTSRKT